MAERITVLISGRGSNLAALLAAMRHGALGGAVTHVISQSSRMRRARLARGARRRDDASSIIAHFATRDAFDAALAAAIDAARARPRRARRLHARARRRRSCAATPAGMHQHPSVAAARVSRPAHASARAGRRRARARLHRALRDAGRRRRPDHRAGGGAACSTTTTRRRLAARVLAAEHRLLPAARRAGSARVAWSSTAGRVRVDDCARMPPRAAFRAAAGARMSSQDQSAYLARGHPAISAATTASVRFAARGAAAPAARTRRVLASRWRCRSRCTSASVVVARRTARRRRRPRR